MHAPPGSVNPGVGADYCSPDARQQARPRPPRFRPCLVCLAENLYGIGLTQYPGALIINKRFANIPAGAPIFMFNWAEDNIIRERVFVPADKQIGAELHPNTLPGAPGSAGPVTAN